MSEPDTPAAAYNRTAWNESKTACTLWFIAGSLYAAFTWHYLWLPGILIFVPGIFIASLMAALFFIPIWFISEKIEFEWIVHRRKRWGLLFVSTVLRLCLFVGPIVGAIYYVKLLRLVLE